MISLYTVATHNYGYLNGLIESATKYNYNINVLGKNQEWKGLIWKLELLKTAIQNTPDDEIIAFCDGFDVLITQDSSLCIQHFLSQDCDILFGYETSTENTYVKYFSQMAFTYAKHLPYNMRPNSGIYIGYAKPIKKFINACISHSKSHPTIKDDQDITYYLFFIQKTLDITMKLTDKLYTVPMKNNCSTFLTLLCNIQYEVDITLLPRKINEVFFIHTNGNRRMDSVSKILQVSTGNFTTESKHNHVTHYIKKMFY